MSRTPAGLSLDPHTAAYVRGLAERLRVALGNKLAGVYLHGSAVLGDFVRARSDLDLVAVSEGPLAEEESTALADAVSFLPCPAAGLELHVVGRGTLAELGEPPPFELHLAPRDRIVVGRGREGDPDLVMHYAVVRAHGVAVAGPQPADVFPPVSRERLLRTFAGELRWALERASPAYQVLNACRAWRFLEENVLTSKLAGAAWARERVRDAATIEAAAAHRRAETEAQPQPLRARAFVESVLSRLEAG